MELNPLWPSTALRISQSDRKVMIKMLLIMKFTAFFLFIAALQLSAKTNGQTISLREKNASLQKVFAEIEKQTNYSFVYTDALLQKAKKVDVQIKEANLQQVLELLFKEQPFAYTIVDRVIVVKPKSEDSPKEVNPNDASTTLSVIDVSGRVTDSEGNPLAGASVKVKGTTTGTTTDANGVYLLKDVDENATLIFSYAEHVAVEISIGKRSSITVALKRAESTLQEVVINKGYYTEKQITSTSNVFTVKAKDIEKQPVNNPLLALVGRVPGLQIQQQTGFANSAVTVRIQGTNSLGAGLDPLYVIDGVPYANLQIPSAASGGVVLGTSGGGVAGNPLSFLNPNDIESIDVLKDADATAIYGSRGANGVILITTKKGRSGKTKINFNTRTGWGQMSNKVKLLNTQQYLAMRKEGYKNDGVQVPNQNNSPNDGNYDLTVWDQNRYTDWQEALIGNTARYTDAQLTFSGGNANTQFLIGTGYHKETTIFPGDFSDRKGSLQFNINHSDEKQKFKLQLSGTYVVDDNQVPGRDVTADAFRIAPNAPKLYNDDGSLNWEPVVSGTGTVSSWSNPLSFLELRYSTKSNNIIGRALLSYQVLPGLSISSSFGYSNLQIKELAINPLAAVRPEFRAASSRYGLYGDGTTSNWIIEPQATYTSTLGKGKIEGLIGSTFQDSKMIRQQLGGLGQSSDLLIKDIRSASTIIVLTNISNTFKYSALFGRLNYNWQNKYITNFTVRRDGSSRFGAKNQFANFYSIAGAWLFSNEGFISKKLDFLNFGKLRASYGISGNDQIGEYGFMNLFSSVGQGVPYQGLPVLQPTGHTNPYLQWEETRKLQFGLDLGFVKDRIQLNVNYYLNRSSNLLIQNALSSNTGFNGVRSNFEGIVQNSGWEIALNTANIRYKDFTWTSSINFTIPVDNGKLKSFPNLAKTIYANQYVVGNSILDSRRYHSLGVDAATGKYIFEDVNENPIFSPVAKDQTRFVNLSQRLYGGIQNVFQYKGFQFDFTFQYVKRKAPLLLYNYPVGFFQGLSNIGNQPLIVLDRWQKAGDNARFQRFTGSGVSDVTNANAYFGFSDGAIVDATYLKLTNASFSWNLPDKWRKNLKLQNASLFVQGQNLFTLDKYKGIDASTGASTSMPPIRVVTVGGQITF